MARRSLALLLVLLITSSACGSDGSGVRTDGQADGSEDQNTESAVASSMSEAEPCAVSAASTGPVFDEGLTSEHGDPPTGQESFDWDLDGSVDDLTFDPPEETVAVEFDGSEIVVEGVPSDFSDELVLAERPGGPELEAPSPQGPPTEAAYQQQRAAPTPAAVADVTGDGLPDLAVVENGDLTVIVGQPANGTGTVVVDLAEMHAGSDPGTPVWTNTNEEAGTDLPLDLATVVPVGDVNADGIGDLRVDTYLARSYAPPAFYFGKPCQS